MPTGVRIDYKALRQINAEAARKAVLEYLASCGHNIAETARVFGITRPVVYTILRKQQEGDLTDCSRVPHRRPRQTSPLLRSASWSATTRPIWGPNACRFTWPSKYEGLEVSWATIRHILRRSRAHLSPAFGRRHPSTARPFVDWYAAKPFEIIQIDLKYIRGQKALSQEQIAHLDRCGIPNFQWGALDVTSRFKLVAYSQERTWTNGLCFYPGLSPGCAATGSRPRSPSRSTTEKKLAASPGSSSKNCASLSPASAALSSRTTRAIRRRTPT